jgi:hypothetical protein
VVRGAWCVGQQDRHSKGLGLDIGMHPLGQIRINLTHQIEEQRLCAMPLRARRRRPTRRAQAQHYSRGQGSRARDQECCGITMPPLIDKPAQSFCPLL